MSIGISRKTFRLDGPVVLGTAGILAIFGVWQVLASTGAINPVVASSPSRVFAEFGPLWQSGQLTDALGASGFEFLVATAISLVFGAAIGLVMYVSRFMEYALDPIVWFVYSAPIVTLYPILIIWFGLGRPAAIATGVLLGIVPVIINTKAGLESTDRLLHPCRPRFRSVGTLRDLARGGAVLDSPHDGRRAALGRSHYHRGDRRRSVRRQ